MATQQKKNDLKILLEDLKELNRTKRIAAFFRKYPTIDKNPIFQVVSSSLTNFDSMLNTINNFEKFINDTSLIDVKHEYKNSLIYTHILTNYYT